MEKLITITELSKLLKLVSKDEKPLNYILRYWENEFRQIKPKIINKRRYYSPDQVELIRLIKFLIRDKGMTINGVKKFLISNKKLDDINSISLINDYYKKKIKDKSKNILSKLNKLKKNGKKNSH